MLIAHGGQDGTGTPVAGLTRGWRLQPWRPSLRTFCGEEARGPRKNDSSISPVLTTAGYVARPRSIPNTPRRRASPAAPSPRRNTRVILPRALGARPDSVTEQTTLPSVQHRYPGLPALPEHALYVRREGVFLVLAGLFLGTLAMLNILGISRFIDLSFDVPGLGHVPVPLAVGVLPYPVTFLCTDFICEIYGRRRASFVVMLGAGINLWVMGILWLGGVLPGPPNEPHAGAFFAVRELAFGAVTASMVAYLVSQLVDVRLFHFWKRVTQGRHLWLRNNGSTLLSQLVDTTAVILVTHFLSGALPLQEDRALWPQLLTFIAAGYSFKLVVALLDTVPFYVGVHYLCRYLRLPIAHSFSAVSPSS